jgi:hypothetical protein
MRLRLRVQQLENQLAQATLMPPILPQPPANSNIETTNTQLGGTFHVSQDRDSLGQHQAIYRSVFHKTRLLGQSHWAVNVLLVSCHILVSYGPYLTNIRYVTYSNYSRRIYERIKLTQPAV